MPGARAGAGAEALADANRDYPEITSPGNKDLEALHYGPGFGALIGELTGEEFARHIGEKFGVSLDDAATTVTVRKFSEASDGNIHTDHWSKLITVLVYFNTDWDEQSGHRGLCRRGPACRRNPAGVSAYPRLLAWPQALRR